VKDYIGHAMLGRVLLSLKRPANWSH